MPKTACKLAQIVVLTPPHYQAFIELTFNFEEYPQIACIEILFVAENSCK